MFSLALEKLVRSQGKYISILGKEHVALFESILQLNVYTVGTGKVSFAYALVLKVAKRMLGM